MALLFISNDDSPVEWQDALTSFDPDLDFRTWPDLGTASDIEIALVWKHPPGSLADLPRLKLIQSLGAGADHILTDPQLPGGVPIARLVDSNLTQQMVEFAVLAVLSRHRRMKQLQLAQTQSLWNVIQPIPTHHSRVGMLGFGEIGREIGNALTRLGFPVTAWTRTAREDSNIVCQSGENGLVAVLHSSDILICLLPFTEETKNILNADTFATLPKGAYVINMARGGHLVESHLLSAIDDGHLSGAWLDVFNEEPLPSDHLFWKHPKVIVTPHLAGLTVASSAAEQVIKNLRLVRSGQAPNNAVNLKHGY